MSGGKKTTLLQFLDLALARANCKCVVCVMDFLNFSSHFISCSVFFSMKPNGLGYG